MVENSFAQWERFFLRRVKSTENRKTKSSEKDFHLGHLDLPVDQLIFRGRV